MSALGLTILPTLLARADEVIAAIKLGLIRAPNGADAASFTAAKGARCGRVQADPSSAF